MTSLLLALLALTCPPSGELTFVCGAQHPEDLAHIPGTPWLIASGYSDGAGLKIVDTRSDTLIPWYTGAPEQVRPDATSYPDCPSPPDAAVFNAHGISLKQQTLYVVNHGGRESIEVFSVTAGDSQPGLVWKGCVLMPEGMAANSVSAFHDGTILASVLTRPGMTITDFVQGAKTGGVFQWKPGTKGFELIPGTELPGNNGLETSPDDQSFYVVAFGWHAVVVYSRAHPDKPIQVVVAPGFMPDNIHWDNGRLLAAGMVFDEPACGGTRKLINGKADDMHCHRGFSVAELDPGTLHFNMVAYSGPNADFNGVSAAAIVGNQLWLGSYQADRIAHRTLLSPAISGDPITTTSGQVKGVQLKSGVRAYLGIRYAAPPTRNLRWQPPQPIRWDGIWTADRKGAECIQVLRPHNINHYFGEEPSSEDCLYLNIWTPAGAKDLPVIVFLYGGGGTIGSSGMALYDGDVVAAHGAVYVNLNYRVGALGFMAHPELTREQGGHSGNYGYLDQNAALQWIHANIAAFGGDPGKVLLAGQSFGAGSVAAQMFSPLSQGLFRGAAMWSACNFTTSGPDLRTAEQTGLELQQRLGAASLEQMRNVPADRILAQQAESQVGAKAQGIRTPPLIDGYFTVGPKDNILVDVPIMVSSNGDDLDANMSPLTRAKTVQEYEASARQLYGADAAKFSSLFPAKKDSDVYAAAHAAARESGMLKASRTCAQKQRGSAAYISLFSHKHPYAPGVTFADQDPATVGAYHSADIPYWLGTFDAFNLFRVTRLWTDHDRHLSEVMLGALIRFAGTGSPGWPAWSAHQEQYLSLGDEITAMRLQAARMDWLAAHPLESAPTRSTPRD